MNVGGSKLPFSEAPSFLTSRILPFSRPVKRIYRRGQVHVPDHAYKYLLRVRGSELPMYRCMCKITFTHYILQVGIPSATSPR